MRFVGFLVFAVAMVVAGLSGLGFTQVYADSRSDVVETLTVAEMAVGTGYDRETRRIEGEAQVFPAGTELLWCRTRITGAESSTTVTHVWYHRDKTLAHVDLHVNSPDWRTVSSKRLLPDWTGPWEVKVIDKAGVVLGSMRFSVE